MNLEKQALAKPLLRGHFHQAAFFFALGACCMLLALSKGSTQVIANVIYALTLAGLFAISTLYHRPQWSPNARMWMRRLDHSAIFTLIAGTGTPLCLIALPEPAGMNMLILFWASAVVGVGQSLFWVSAPKWLAAILYIFMGWLAVPYLPELKAALGATNLWLLVVGGIIYTGGALVYALKKPNPWPRVFGYHEIFHLLVVIAAFFHFVVIANLVM